MTAVFLGASPLNLIDHEALAGLAALSRKSRNGVARYCLHASPNDSVQEMLIHMRVEACTLPHRQVGKRKSYIVVEGELCVLFFDDVGRVIRKEILTPPTSPGPTVMSFLSDTFHTTVCLGKEATYIETIPGPFDPDKTEWAPWITSKDSHKEVDQYLAILIEQDQRIAENWRSSPPLL